MERFRNRRKKYYINKRFQRMFILKFCTLVVMGAAITGIIIYALSGSTVTTTFENSRLTIKSTADYILPVVLLAGGIMVVFISIATIIVTVFASHKIAGPLYRMEKDIDAVTDGNLNVRINLRATDEVKPLASSLDKMVRALRGRIAAVKETLDGMERSGQLSPEMKDKIKKAKDEINKFTT